MWQNIKANINHNFSVVAWALNLFYFLNETHSISPNKSWMNPNSTNASQISLCVEAVWTICQKDYR